MRQLAKVSCGILLFTAAFLTLWIFFYICADNYTFHLSVTNINLASIEAVQAMFWISIIASLFLALLLSVITIITYFRLVRRFYLFNALMVVILIAAAVYIMQTDNYIPFVRDIDFY
ncbi:hypothetical protein DNH61_02895 [Paenibacillus sambharensis]|uniref:Uncharacterized protein n=1 Tax=Paenibacillus sambharensis TaxID=1803190 RepID=A0A2W1LE03_9BACL|nr:hypothetical protein [Paenibacillus sambharensis]PZD97316.1 hypothetical protein DNH61_02895 [Paenibacillus sambharensis]